MTTSPNKKPWLYFDTNILIDLIERTDDNVIILVETAKKKGWTYLISAFTAMETADIRQEHKYFHNKVEKGTPLKHIISNRRERDLNKEDIKDINKHIERKKKDYNIIWAFYIDTGEDWKLALDITMETNINCNDAIHVAQAYHFGCQILVTNDTFLIKEGNEYLKENDFYEELRICKPIDVEKNLEEMKLLQKGSLQKKCINFH